MKVVTGAQGERGSLVYAMAMALAACSYRRFDPVALNEHATMCNAVLLLGDSFLGCHFNIHEAKCNLVSGPNKGIPIVI